MINIWLLIMDCRAIHFGKNPINGGIPPILNIMDAIVNFVIVDSLFIT